MDGLVAARPQPPHASSKYSTSDHLLSRVRRRYAGPLVDSRDFLGDASAVDLTPLAAAHDNETTALIRTDRSDDAAWAAILDAGGM